ncbi:MAG: S8 family serine peptidase, partial [Candidatus Aminicenantes bacterium]|nr:S8 family serine peptidase [Candidatus Aminicenantes bacterium]
GYDYGDDDSNPSPAGDGAHGTACAGIVGATQGNAAGVTGIAPLSRIMPIKIWKDNGQSASVSDTADAIDFAWQNGAHVLSNSWGFSSASHTIFPVITAAIGRAKTQGRNGLGSVVVFAAGNTADHSKGQPGYATFPGSRSNVLTVGASDRYDKQANYSPTDNDVDIVAPSHKAYRCQIATEDFEVWTTDITGNAGYNPYHNPGSDCLPPHGTKLPKDNDNYTGLMGGTSASCPLTAGIAALLLSVNPNLTAVEAEDIIKTTAEKINNSAGTYNASGHSARYGYGRVNAHRAIVPTVIISVKPKRVQKGKPFSVKVTGSAPFGLKSIWWFGKETGIADIDKAHWHNVSDSKKVYTYKWTGVTINKKGTFTLGANARDVKYPTPGDGFPHQASEGSGIAYTTVKVPTLAGWGIILLSLLFIVSAATRKKGTSINS